MRLLCTHTHTQFAAAFIRKDTVSTNLMWSTHIQTQQTHGHSDLALVGPLIWRLPVGFVYIYFSIHCFIDFFFQNDQCALYQNLPQLWLRIFFSILLFCHVKCAYCTPFLISSNILYLNKRGYSSSYSHDMLRMCWCFCNIHVHISYSWGQFNMYQ